MSVAALAAAIGAAVAAVGQAAPAPSLHAGDMRGIVPVRAAGHASTSNVLLAYHAGPVMTSGAAVTPVFWGTSWSGYSGDKVSGLTTFYKGIGGSPYLGTNTEYTDAGGTHVGTAISFAGPLTDTSSAGRKAPSTSTVLAVVAKNVKSPTQNGYYPVYSDIPRGSAGYCAWHSWGTIGTVQVQFAFFFNLDNDPGCDVSDGSHSTGLASLANVSGHELSEALTDPQGTGWFDRRGAENADKCAWTFSDKPIAFGGTTWRIQGNFSNVAYQNRAGYDGGGCIDGT